MGSVPKELVIDNLKAFVEKVRKSANVKVLLNSKFEDFFKDYKITPYIYQKLKEKLKHRIK